MLFRHNFHVPASRLEDIEILATTTCIPELRGCQPGLNPMNNTLDCGEPTVRTLPILPRVRCFDKAKNMIIEFFW